MLSIPFLNFSISLTFVICLQYKFLLQTAKGNHNQFAYSLASPEIHRHEDSWAKTKSASMKATSTFLLTLPWLCPWMGFSVFANELQAPWTGIQNLLFQHLWPDGRGSQPSTPPWSAASF